MTQLVVYGIHAVQQALQSAEAGQLFLQSGRQDKRVQTLKDLACQQHVTINEVDKAQLDQMVSGRHQGAVLVLEGQAQQQHQSLEAVVKQAGEQALVLVLDGVQDPHNLGACLRTADAAGVHAVVVPKDNACVLTPVVRKVACGAAEMVPFFAVTNVARTITDLQAMGCWATGLTGEADQSLYEIDCAGPTVIVMGAEGTGMRRLTKEKCDFLAKLPMAGSVSSLNVSVATGVVLYEVVRQRSAK